MTSVVGILNKQAVAIAADSAVTITTNGNNRRIFNHALKIFTLSKFHPVGIMIYNSASFMSTPWETIIKVYRKQLGKKQFPTVKAYQEDFLKFLHKKNFYSDEKIQKMYLGNLFSVVIEVIIRESIKGNENLVSAPTPANRKKIIDLITLKVDEYLKKLNSNKDECPEFTNYTIVEFKKFSDELFKQVIEQHFTRNNIPIARSLQDKINNLLYLFVKSKDKLINYTGLIFVGFGEEEIYPHLIPLNVSLAIQNRLRYYIEEKMVANITNESGGAIRPFAQIDVINTILSGVDPTLEKTYLSNFEASFKKYNDEILKLIGTNNPVLSAQIKGLDIGALVKKYAIKNNEMKQINYIKPLMNAVSSLSKEDLAEMAESLIYLTYLKRRITFAEESVGGPVDVAIISKGDGFIWIKRKHYFKPELNKHFFDNYLNP